MNNKVIYLEIDGKIEANQDIPSGIWITALTEVGNTDENDVFVVKQLQFSGVTTRCDSLTDRVNVRRTRIRITDSITYQRIAVVCQALDQQFRSKFAPYLVPTKARKTAKVVFKEDKVND